MFVNEETHFLGEMNFDIWEFKRWPFIFLSSEISWARFIEQSVYAKGKFWLKFKYFLSQATDIFEETFFKKFDFLRVSVHGLALLQQTIDKLFYAKT